MGCFRPAIRRLCHYPPRQETFALIGVLALCFGAALLIDMQFYVSASFAALLAGFSAMAYVVQHVKLKRAEHQRLLRKAEAARQRAIAAQARLERIDTAKSGLDTAIGPGASSRTMSAWSPTRRC